MRNPPRSSPVREQPPFVPVLVRQVTQKRTTRLHGTVHSRGKGGWEKNKKLQTKAVMLRSSVYLQSGATARSQPLDGCHHNLKRTSVICYWQRMYDSLVRLSRLILLRTYMIVSTFMWSSLYLRDILSQHYTVQYSTVQYSTVQYKYLGIYIVL